MSDGYLEFGKVRDGSGDVFLGGTVEAYDEAIKGLSGDETHILRVKRSQVPWLAERLCSCLAEDEFDHLMAVLEDRVERAER